MGDTQRVLIKPIFDLPEGSGPVYPEFKSPEEKMYIILIVYKDELRECTFKICEGRSEAAREAKFAVLDAADLEESRVLVEGVLIEDSLNLYWFMRRIKEVNPDSDFDVDDFLDKEPTTEESKWEIPEQFDSTARDNEEETDELDI